MKDEKYSASSRNLAYLHVALIIVIAALVVIAYIDVKTNNIVRPIYFIAFTFIISFFCVSKTKSGFKKLQTIRDNPISLIRSAAHGFVELEGVLKNNEIKSPVTNTECCYWTLRVETKNYKC